MKEASQDYINQDCPTYNEYDMKVKPFTKSKDYQVQKENLMA